MSQSPRDTAGEQGSTGAVVELSDSERYRLLDSVRRRHAISVLAAETTPLQVDELASAVARREGDVEAAEPEAVERLRIGLHHNHLPRMDELDLLDYDREERRVDACRIPHDLSPS